MTERPDRKREYFFDENEAGRLRYTERHWPGPIAWAVLLATPSLIPLIGWRNVTSPGIGLFLYGGSLVVMSVFYLTGLINRVKIYDRAVVLSTNLKPSRPYVVPLSTIDPSRIRYHRRVNFIGRRLSFGRRNIRAAVYASQAVCFDGLSPWMAHDRLRREGPDHSSLSPTARGIAVELDDAPGSLEVQTWVVSTRTPRKLLRAIEDALVDFGRTDAAGMTDRLLADPVVERWRKPLTEDEIYRPR
ncbi:hypothetical protein CLV30_101297 [Haloactinopolyspora alba]|uniref:Uncharacterized protein n=1 Tax=Haloactinopolyspora alba TaxID=648780 RepID=A0A2P8EFT3_9ACTN|nr:hypothetical protein [Haloactinopolyspora alba]PSL08326.1 hypothetical protein CLV30_101297 [Haloactinopolyspora alba]